MIPPDVEIDQHLRGVVCVGVAQDKANAWTAAKQVRGRHVYLSYRRRTVCVNHYYLCVIDPEWGPTILKVYGYTPRSRNAALTATRAHQAPA